LSLVQTIIYNRVIISHSSPIHSTGKNQPHAIMVVASGEWLASGDNLVLCVNTEKDPLITPQRQHDDKDSTTTTDEKDNINDAHSTSASTPSKLGACHPSDVDTGETPVQILVEIVGATLPRPLSSSVSPWEDSRGVHCTVHWVGPPLPSGRKRRERWLHRTKSLPVGRAAASAIGPSAEAERTDDNDEEVEDDDLFEESVFTVDDGAFFAFRTTIRELAGAAAWSAAETASSNRDDDDDGSYDDEYYLKRGGLRFDVFLKPMDTFSTVSRYIAASTASEKEAHAVAFDESSVSSTAIAGYRLVGSAFVASDDILKRCNEERFELDLDGELRKRQQLPAAGSFHSSSGSKSSTGGKLALRWRLASQSDLAFLQSLADVDNSTDTADANRRRIRLQSPRSHDPLPKSPPLLTEVDEHVMTVHSSIKALTSMAPVARESMRYLFSSDDEPRVLVKPHPDPDRLDATTFLTEAELRDECYKPSKYWIQAGSGALGKVYLEILRCRGLPNVDAGESFGNKTDAFVTVVYDDVMVQTDVIDDSLSPMWLPWQRRAFVLRMTHPSTALYVGVTDYDVGPLEHENIGRIAIPVGTNFVPGLVYTLTYRLNESSNYTDFGTDDMGTITLRLRVEYDEPRHLLLGKNRPDKQWVSATQWKSHRIAKYCVDGPHDGDVFEMRLFRSHIHEILTQKRNIARLVKDALYSLVFWKGQVNGLPIHSAVAFGWGVHVVENPRLLPSAFFFLCGWVMISNMFRRRNHPNPWQRGPSFGDYWNVLVHGRSMRVPKEIRPYENEAEARKYEKLYSDRLEEENKQYEKQVELAQKLADISNDTIIRTKAKANTALADPIAALAGARLLPYQQRLSRVCDTMRYYRNILNWNESVLSFWVTLTLFGLAAVSLIVPWGFLLQWTSRFVVWVFLGPWMKLVDIVLHGMTSEEEQARAKAKSLRALVKSFREEKKKAKVLRENALKLKAFRVKLFGEYITRLPEYNLTRHEDIPLPESKAEIYRGNDNISIKAAIAGQSLCGQMIPRLGQDNDTAIGAQEAAREDVMKQYEKFMQLKRNRSDQNVDGDDVSGEGFELVSGDDDEIGCLLSAVSAECDSINQETDDESTGSDSVGDVVVSDRAIQAALGNRLQRSDVFGRTKSRWSIYASFSLSIKKEMVPNQPLLTSSDNTDAKLVANNDNGSERRMIKYKDDDSDVEEEGVEVVPLSSKAAEESSGNDRVFVLRAEMDSEQVGKVKKY